MGTAHGRIEKLIRQLPEGEVLYPADFYGFGTAAALKMTLSRLSKKGVIDHVGTGIYYVPKTDAISGKIAADPEEVACAIARKEKIQIKPAGDYALYKLGLITEVPLRLAYLTNGRPARKFKIGETTIKFKPATPRKLGLTGKYSSLILHAFEDLNPDDIAPQTGERIRELLLQEEPGVLRRDMRRAVQTKKYYYLLKLLKSRPDSSI